MTSPKHIYASRPIGNSNRKTPAFSTEDARFIREANTLLFKLQEFLNTDYAIAKQLYPYYEKNTITRNALYSRIARGLKKKTHCQDFVKHASKLLDFLQIRQKAEFMKAISRKYFILTPIRTLKDRLYAEKLAKVILKEKRRFIAPAIESVFTDGPLSSAYMQTMELFLGELLDSNYLILAKANGITPEMDLVLTLNTCLDKPKQVISISSEEELIAYL